MYSNNPPCASEDHYKIPFSAQPAYCGVNRETDVKQILKGRACERNRDGGGLKIEEGFSLHIPFQCQRQMTDLDINCLSLRAMKSTSRKSWDRLAETSSASTINTFPWHGALWFYNGPCQWLTCRNLVAWERIPGSMLTVKVGVVYIWRRVLEQWGGVLHEGLGLPTKKSRGVRKRGKKRFPLPSTFTLFLQVADLELAYQKV